MARKRSRGRRGQGSIRTIRTKKGERYQARWSWTEGGVRQQHAKSFDLRDDAVWWLSQARRHGTPDEDPYVRDFMEDWIRSKRNVRDSTRLQYTEHVRLHIIPVLGGHRLTKLRRRHVEAFVEDRLRHVPAGRKHVDRPLSPSTVGKLLVTLRSALESGVPRQIPDNPAARVAAPRRDRQPIAAMTPTDAAQLVAAVRGTWLEHITRVLMGSGMRVGEAVALDQVDVHDGWVSLRRSKTTIRAVRLSADASEAIHEAIRQAPRRGKHEPVFFGPRRRKGDGGQMDRLLVGSVTKGLPAVLANAGLEPITPHRLRHGVATLMVRRGIPMRAIAEQLGHANPSMTARTYAHVAEDSLRDAVMVLDEALSDR